MLMGHSIEGRFPFLDFRLAEFAARAARPAAASRPAREVRAAPGRGQLLPQQIHERPKSPYRAPIGGVFFGPGAARVRRRAAPAARRSRPPECSTPAAVGRLVAKFEARRGRGVSETDEMALVGALSMMLLHEQFVANPVARRAAEGDEDRDRSDAVHAEPVAEAV